MYTEDYENILNRAVRLDGDLQNNWLEMIGDEGYQILAKLFDKDNYFDFDADDWLDVKTVEKNVKKALAGKDRAALVQLIAYSFDLGRLVGRAEQILLTED